METDEAKGKCSCPCHKMIGVFIILFGLTFLLRSLDVISPKAAGIAWPIIVMLAGLKSIFGSNCKCCDKA